MLASRITALIFDFGNVVGFFSHRRACDQIAALSGGQVTADQVHPWIFETGRHVQLETGVLDPEKFLLDLQRELVPSAGLDELRAAYSTIFCPNHVVCDLIVGMENGVPIYLASNTDPIHWASLSKQFAQPFSRFSGFTKSFEIQRRKPSSDFYQRVLIQTGVTAASECLFVDDLVENVAAAEAIGMQGLVYSPQIDLAAELRDRGICV